MSNSTHNFTQSTDLGITFAGVAALNWLVTQIAQQDAFLHGCASIVTIAAAAISIYFTATKRK